MYQPNEMYPTDHRLPLVQLKERRREMVVALQKRASTITDDSARMVRVRYRPTGLKLSRRTVRPLAKLGECKNKPRALPGGNLLGACGPCVKCSCELRLPDVVCHPSKPGGKEQTRQHEHR